MSTLDRFLLPIVKAWKNAKMNKAQEWKFSRCVDCSLPLFGENTICVSCHSANQILQPCVICGHEAMDGPGANCCSRYCLRIYNRY